MRISTKLIILELLGGIFGWIWIGAYIASLYFLYVALANDAASAWHTAMNGGLNLLLRMQQSDESEQLEAIETPSVEANKV